MIPALLVSFPGPYPASRHAVGGKGASLLRMGAAGLPVPPGVILTTAFFEPWFVAVQASSAWTHLIQASPAAWGPLCTAVKAYAQTLVLTTQQHDALGAARQAFGSPDHTVRLAVRSSAPEEDLATASFAGGYETRLGVRPEQLDEAVRACFASSLDVRVLLYKHERGFDVGAPRLSVIVQRQLDSQIAGVGFSLNPLTNDYDEVVINANWGLGTSVVDGQVTLTAPLGLASCRIRPLSCVRHHALFRRRCST
ncbi:MAG: PEP/pyruvate-binding domain-containing protein [Bacteroidota bacterium]